MVHSGLQPALDYLMAVLGENDEMQHPFSEDIGGLPQVLQEESVSESDSSSLCQAQPVDVDLEEDSDTEPHTELPPSYDDVTEKSFHECLSQPPSYDSLPSPCHPSPAGGPGHGLRNNGSTGKLRVAHQLANILSSRKLKKMGYHKQKD